MQKAYESGGLGCSAGIFSPVGQARVQPGSGEPLSDTIPVSSL